MKNQKLATARDTNVTEPLPDAAMLKRAKRAMLREAARTPRLEPDRSHVRTFQFDILHGWFMRMLRVREAAIYLGCKPAFVRKLIADGEIRYIGDNGQPWRIDRNDLDAWI